MAQTCRRCSRANPDEASYCHHDGGPLDVRSANGSQSPPGWEPFPRALVFAGGPRCRNFHELAGVCCAHWEAAVSHLRQGVFEAFFTSIGRLDLARLAREAARNADPDRGLDELLSHFPGPAGRSPRLNVPARDIDLGPLTVGADRGFEIELLNDGLRLLCGTATCGCDWLTLDDTPAGANRTIRFGSRMSLPVRVRGDRLRAGPRPLEACLFLDTEGGQALITLRAEVPIVPFEEGVLAGARSPRQLAEKARAAPRDAARLFSNGAVATWYRRNGWAYPVQGEPVWGVGAVQQFLRALGLPDTFEQSAGSPPHPEPEPPHLDLSEPSVQLRASAGSRLDHFLTLRAPGTRTVHARATSDQAWLQVGPTVLDEGRATIPLMVPVVPSPAGERLEARVTVVAAGEQRFVVPVTLVVLEAPVRPERTRPASPVIQAPSAPMLSGKRRRKRVALLAGIPVLVLAGVLFRTWFTEEGLPPLVELPIESQPRLALAFDSKMRFGLVLPGEKDIAGRVKKLTSTESGQSNSTLLRIDGKEVPFGSPPGVWKETDARTAADLPEHPADRSRATCIYPEELISVTQIVEIVAASQVATGQSSRHKDTCFVRYRIENKDDRGHRIGLRLLLDTHVGSRDGEPIWLPGENLPCTTSSDLGSSRELPDFIQILEKPSLESPGVVAQLSLRSGSRVEPPSRLKLGGWPRDGGWDVGVESTAGDSALVLYWEDKELGPRDSREVGFAYGLGSLSNSESAGTLGIAVGGSFRPGDPFTVSAYVAGATSGQTVTLKLPRGCELVSGKPTQAASTVTEGPQPYLTLLTWRVRATGAGTFTLRAQSSTGHVQSQPVTIRSDG